MNKIASVEIGVACAPNQTPQWWAKIMALLLGEQERGIEILRINTSSSAVPDWNKNSVLYEKRRASLTDANRQAVVSGFLAGKAEWLFWLDDDTVPPNGVITHLVNLRREFCAGLYFLPKPPHNPIAYMREPSGKYAALWNYPRGALVQVDSVGMGCTLIHRSVYEKIRAEHVVYQRPDGSIFPMHKSKVHNRKKRAAGDSYVKDGSLHMPVIELDPEAEEGGAFPFYALEYGRTEDHHFCELAASVGFRPWVDTNIMCEHLKTKATTVEDYRASLAGGEQ